MLVYCVGTMKIDHPDTPFLFLDADDPCGEVAAIHPKYLSTHLPMAERTGAPLARCGGNSKALFGRPACLSHQASWPRLVDPGSCPGHPLALAMPARVCSSQPCGRILVGGANSELWQKCFPHT
jgi:hypothetical protein